MKKENLQKEAFKDLSHILDQKGEVIYSSHKTLKKGDIYLLGYNPGATKYCSHQILNAEIGDKTIRAHLKSMLTKTHNSYIEENWSTKDRTYDEGKAPLQKRVKSLFEYLDYDTEDVCASNLIFVTSQKAEQVDSSLAEYCWRFHERVIDLVQPKIIFCFGISSFNFLESLLNIKNKKIDIKPSGHGNWNCKSFKTIILNRETLIIGLPHLSRYAILNYPDVLEWIKEKVTQIN